MGVRGLPATGEDAHLASGGATGFEACLPGECSVSPVAGSKSFSYHHHVCSRPKPGPKSSVPLELLSFTLPPTALQASTALHPGTIYKQQVELLSCLLTPDVPPSS